MRLTTAKWEPVSRIDDGPRDLRYNAVLLHTAATNASDLKGYWESGAPPGVGAHVYVNEQGEAFQYLDTNRRTGHAWDANPWSWAIETWDNGDPEHVPWNQTQLDKIDAILREAKILPQALKCSAGNGVGYHQQCSTWNKSGHNCPGSKRRAQIPGIIARLKGSSSGSGGGGSFLDDTTAKAMVADTWEALKQEGALYETLDKNPDGSPLDLNMPPTEGDAGNSKYKGWVGRVVKQRITRTP